MDVGSALTRGTVWAALVLYAVAIAIRLAPGRCQGWHQVARFAWLVGCAAYLAHVACAFHFHHGWSHSHAMQETARQTRELFGWDWGGGLYFNYLFTLIWVADAAWWLVRPRSYLARPLWMDATVHGFLAFMTINATVVFPSGPIRWIGLIVFAILAVFAAMKVRARIRNKSTNLG